MTPATLLIEQFDHLLATPEAVAELNRAILTLAVQGKLVEQDPQDEPASELLKRISRIRGKYSDQSSNDYEGDLLKLPNGWASATISDLISQNGVFVDGDWVESKDQDPEGEVRLTQLADIGDGEYRNKSNRFMTSQKASQLGCTYLELGDVLVARMPDPLGRACIFPGDKQVCVTVVDVCIIRPGTTDIFNKWLMCAINSQDFRIAIDDKKSGTTRQRISRSNLAKLRLSVPPLAEQNRIVARVEALFAQTRQLAEKLTRAQRDLALLNQSALAHLLAASASTVRQAHGSAREDFTAQWDFIAGHFESLFTEPEHIAPLRQAILELAVRGKLTRHEASDEPARALLARIQSEKAKVGDSEPLSPMKESEKPFELPEGWGFIQLGDLARFIDYRGHTPVKTETGLRLITAKNVRMGYLNLEPREYVDPAIYDKWMTRGIPKKGDLLFTTEAPMGNVSLLDTDEKALFAQRLITLRMYGGVNSKFVMYALMSQPLQRQILDKSSGVTARGIKARLFKTVLMIIPPLAEQERIVAKVEQLLGLCDALEAKLRSAREGRERLTAAVLAGVGGVAAYAGN